MRVSDGRESPNAFRCLEAADFDALREADAAASVAHDFVFGLNGVTKEEAGDAIWRVHHALRPLIARDLRAGEHESGEA